ncbi:quinone oxidoreductase family protein [Peristeroidobacter soli]|uniref:quinone oxidoreductase family protein n=1 Tax=Peristeroidobacter soli TaxID=2497877 RepID=UPI00101C0B1D|nr:zinc-binding dehydrogenase [Peristeroidobacter soli]
MKALVVNKVGVDPTMGWACRPVPTPGEGELLVEVHAVTLSWGDVIQAGGAYVGGPVPPFTPGHDFSGKVVGVGAQVDADRLGTRVFGLLPAGGSLAEFIVVPAADVDEIPGALDYVGAAAIPASFLTADAALNMTKPLSSDDVVIVHAGAGGLGSAALQLCRAARVKLLIATAGTGERGQFARELGADHVATYENFAEVVGDLTGGRGADLILDSIGGTVFDRSIAALAPFGRLVSVGATSAEAAGRLRLSELWRKSITVAGLHLSRWAAERPARVIEIRQRILNLLQRNEIRPLVGEVYGAERFQDAYRALASRQVRGRAAILMRQQ